MIRYKYDPNNYKYIGEHECQESPLEEGVFLYPPNTTDVTPPFEEEGVYIFSEDANTWIVLEDRSKRTWYLKSTGEIVTNYNEYLEYTYTEEPRPNKYCTYVEEKFGWVEDKDKMITDALLVLSDYKDYLYSNKITVEDIGDVNGGEKSYNIVCKLIEYLKSTKEKNVEYKMFDNEYKKLTSKDLEEIRNEFIRLEQKLFKWYQEEKEKIKAIENYSGMVEYINSLEDEEIKNKLKAKLIDE